MSKRRDSQDPTIWGIRFFCNDSVHIVRPIWFKRIIPSAVRMKNLKQLLTDPKMIYQMDVPLLYILSLFKLWCEQWRFALSLIGCHQSRDRAYELRKKKCCLYCLTSFSRFLSYLQTTDERTKKKTFLWMVEWRKKRMSALYVTWWVRHARYILLRPSVQLMIIAVICCDKHLLSWTM